MAIYFSGRFPSIYVYVMSVYPNILELKPNQLCTYYLTSSYLYYKEDLNVLTDTDYDLLCNRLYQMYDEVTHPHKKLIDKESLGAGTGYGLEEYPTRIKMAAIFWYNEWKEQVDATS